MFLILGTRPRVKPVPGGRRVAERCPRCRQTRLMAEHEARSYVHVFFLPVFPLGPATRVLRCEECSADVYLDPEEEGGAESRAEEPSGDAMLLPCDECRIQLRVRTSKRKLTIRCPKCRTEYEIHRK